MSQRDAEARFRSLFDAHHRSVARALAYYGVSAADQPDLVQEVFLSVYSALQRGKHPSHDSPAPVWRAWLRQFARRHAANYRRSARDETELLEVASSAAAPDPERVAARRELLALLLGELEDEPREIFLDARAEGLSWEEIARERGLSIDQARYLHRKAIERMEEIMKSWEKGKGGFAAVPLSMADLLAALPPLAVLSESMAVPPGEALDRREDAATRPRAWRRWAKRAVGLPSHASMLAAGGILGWALHDSPKDLSATAPLPRSRTVESRASAETSPASREPAPPEAPAATTAPPQSAPPISIARRSSAPERRSTGTSSGSLKDEQLLDQAQAALVAGDAHAALAALAKRDGHFAEGPSASVRQRLLVRACALLGGRAGGPCAPVLAAKGR